jgi:hypothetical protein
VGALTDTCPRPLWRQLAGALHALLAPGSCRAAAAAWLQAALASPSLPGEHGGSCCCPLKLLGNGPCAAVCSLCAMGRVLLSAAQDAMDAMATQPLCRICTTVTCPRGPRMLPFRGACNSCNHVVQSALRGRSPWAVTSPPHRYPNTAGCKPAYYQPHHSAIMHQFATTRPSHRPSTSNDTPPQRIR